MQRVNHSILPKKHPRKKSAGYQKARHNSFYERGDRTHEYDPRHDTSGILPVAGPEYGFAYASAWPQDVIEKKKEEL